MALEDEVEKALRDAGAVLKADLWQPSDAAFLKARATDLVGLNRKADTATDPMKKRAYVAAARDVVNHVRLLAVIRMEVAAHHVLDALGRFFVEKVVPALLALLPSLIGL
jgi:hypothetical protein